MKNIYNIFLLSITLLIFIRCDKSNPGVKDDIPTIHQPFKEGTIEMGMYSNGIDLGYFIDHIDFSRDNIKEQLEELTQSTEGSPDLLALISEMKNRNPFLAFTLILNANICTYYVKNNVVLGKAKGFGWELENLHDRLNDIGKVAVRTLVSTDQISEANKEVYAAYSPSEDLAPGYFGYLDYSIFDRQVDAKKEKILGYECQKSTYTLNPEHAPIPSDLDDDVLFPTATLYKLVVYSSAQFDKTINFTHPFYLPEDMGIIKLEIYYEDSATPTLVMQPKSITPRTIAASELQVNQGKPIYNIYDLEFGQKVWPIMLSGWGSIGEEKIR